MIVIISEKKFIENMKKLTGLIDYEIVNGTENDKISSKSSYAKDASEGYVAELDPSKKMFDKEISDTRRKELINKFLKKPAMTSVIANIVSYQLTTEKGDSVIYVVVQTKGIKLFGKKMVKRFKKIIGLDEDSIDIICFDHMDDIDVDSPDVAKENKKELAKLDRKIDDIVDDLDNSFWEFADSNDKKDLEKKLKKLRSKRKELAESLNSDKFILTDAAKIKFIKKNMKTSSDSMKKMKKFFQNWKETTDDLKERCGRYDDDDDDD